jgi:hypothetical protein
MTVFLHMNSFPEPGESRWAFVFLEPGRNNRRDDD